MPAFAAIFMTVFGMAFNVVLRLLFGSSTKRSRAWVMNWPKSRCCCEIGWIRRAARAD